MANEGFIQLRVFCGPRNHSGLFVYIRIFSTKREMLMALRTEGKAWGTGGFENGTNGAMQTFKSRKRPGCIGCINLFRRGLTNEIVTHEFAHAMFAYGERKGLTGKWLQVGNTMPIEELYCYALGRMVARFGTRAQTLGLFQ